MTTPDISIISYIISVTLMCIIHIINKSRPANDIIDFFIMTFLPYSIFKLKKYKI